MKVRRGGGGVKGGETIKTPKCLAAFGRLILMTETIYVLTKTHSTRQCGSLRVIANFALKDRKLAIKKPHAPTRRRSRGSPNLLVIVVSGPTLIYSAASLIFPLNPRGLKKIMGKLKISERIKRTGIFRAAGGKKVNR